MAPGYKPLTSAGGLTGAPGIPAEIFNQPAIDFEDAIKQQAVLRAQELNNQVQEINVNRTQRAYDQDERTRQALISRYGSGEQQFDPDEALKVAQQLALQNGDLDTALQIERTQKERKGSSPLSGAQRQLFSQTPGLTELPEGITLQDLSTLAGLQKAGTYAQQVDIQANDPNRALNAEMKRRRMDGTLMRGMTPQQVDEISGIDTLAEFADNISTTYMPYISANRGERFLAAAANPNSAAGRMNNELYLLKAQIAQAYNGKRLSDKDMEIVAPLVDVNTLDTLGTVQDKMDRLVELLVTKKAISLASMKKAKFNTSGFDGGNAGTAIPTSPPPLSNYGAPTGGLPRNPDGSPLTREQFNAMRARGG